MKLKILFPHIRNFLFLICALLIIGFLIIYSFAVKAWEDVGLHPDTKPAFVAFFTLEVMDGMKFLPKLPIDSKHFLQKGMERVPEGDGERLVWKYIADVAYNKSSDIEVEDAMLLMEQLSLSDFYSTRMSQTYRFLFIRNLHRSISGQYTASKYDAIRAQIYARLLKQTLAAYDKFDDTFMGYDSVRVEVRLSSYFTLLNLQAMIYEITSSELNVSNMSCAEISKYQNQLDELEAVLFEHFMSQEWMTKDEQIEITTAQVNWQHIARLTRAKFSAKC